MMMIFSSKDSAYGAARWHGGGRKSAGDVTRNSMSTPRDASGNCRGLLCLLVTSDCQLGLGSSFLQALLASASSCRDAGLRTWRVRGRGREEILLAPCSLSSSLQDTPALGSLCGKPQESFRLLSAHPCCCLACSLPVSAGWPIPSHFVLVLCGQISNGSFSSAQADVVGAAIAKSRRSAGALGMEIRGCCALQELPTPAIHHHLQPTTPNNTGCCCTVQNTGIIMAQVYNLNRIERGEQHKKNDIRAPILHPLSCE